ncbi:unnamed protein product [Mesocestoides corti]|uniref:Pseudouridylate synthase RPUSD4, mitochondrial n=1 Tax=Mesocestoides corti TaxID=53468 RepID=A0A0R3UIJ2_MESCO|nr:unnamed protein product [Mesocestoides corti]
MSYIDSLFFESLPKTSKRITKEGLRQPLVTVDMEENSYIDQTYFQRPEDRETPGSDLVEEETESVADCITGVRDQLSINLYSGGTLNFKNQKNRPLRPRFDSEGFRIPDDDPIKFYLLTEDEAVEVLYKCLISVQDNLLVLNKPPGISCQGGAGQSFSVDSLLPRLAFKLRRDFADETGTLQLSHRLDKEATGILLISRNRDTHLKLTEAFANRWIRKSYLCITSGIPKEREGTIYLPLYERRVRGIYRMFAKHHRSNSTREREVLEDTEEPKVSQEKTNALTHYSVLGRRNDTALVECCATTGVKHQVRVHLSTALGTPILGDHKYSHFGHLAPQRLPKRTLAALEIRQSKARYIGLHLHAHRIQFGLTGAPDTLKSPSTSDPPPGFFSFINRESPRQARHFAAPLPSFFVTNLNRLGMKLPSALRWTRFKLF